MMYFHIVTVQSVQTQFDHISQKFSKLAQSFNWSFIAALLYMEVVDADLWLSFTSGPLLGGPFI